MGRHVTQAACRREHVDNSIGADVANQTAGDARHQATERGSDAAALRVPQEGRHAGRTRHADFHRFADTAGTQLPDPRQNAFG